MDFSFLKPVDLWFWFFFIISFIIIVYTLIFIKNHSEIKFLIILRSITFVIFTFLLLKPKFSWTQYNYNNLDWNLYIDNSVSISYHPLYHFKLLNQNLNKLFIQL